MPGVWRGKNRHRLKRELPFQSRQLRPQRVSVNIQVVPATAALILTTFAPTVATPRVVTPGTPALVLTTFAPTVSTPRVVIPATKALTLTRFAPTVTIVAVPKLGGGPRSKPFYWIPEDTGRRWTQRVMEPDEMLVIAAALGLDLPTFVALYAAAEEGALAA